jgi:hypothetical protein
MPRQFFLMYFVETLIDFRGRVRAEDHIPGAGDVGIEGFGLGVAGRFVQGEVQRHQAVRAPLKFFDALDYARWKVLLASNPDRLRRVDCARHEP